MKSHRASLISVTFDHDQCRKKKVFVKSVSTKKLANMDHITGDKIPRSLAKCMSSVGGFCIEFVVGLFS
ncbi:hypothetical protein ACFX2J_035962 [Malus domestica]